MDGPASQWFVEHIRQGFEHAAAMGTVQYHCDDESFFVTLGEREIVSSPGLHPAPTSTVRVTRDVLRRFVDSPGSVDPRDRSVAPHLQISGDFWLAHFVWWLTFRPTEAYIRRYVELERRAVENPIQHLTRIDKPSDAYMKDAIARGAPVLATGCLEQWPLPHDLESFKSELGHIVFKPYPFSGPGTTLRHFIDVLTEGTARTATNAGGDLPEQMCIRYPPPLFGGEGFADQQFWLGKVENTNRPITPLHRDPIPSLLGHMFGRKRFLLYSPDQAKNLYTLQKTFRKGQLGAVQPWAPDYSRFPLFANAHAIEVDLAPGDLLLIPAGWFHEVYALDTVMSISSFFIDWAAG